MFDSSQPAAPSSSRPASARLSVQPVPAFKDNYLWLIHDGVHAAIVDPGDAAPVLAALAAQRLTLTAILLTHHHADHIGGVPALLAQAAVPVFGPRADGIGAVTHPLGEGDQVEVPGLNLRLRVLDVPGHTLGHIAYVRDAGAVGESGSAGAPDHGAAPWLFCGDTLFAGGCGRLFEGTPAQMRASLQKLAALPAATQVFCAHEYTLPNLRFAAAVEPANEAILQRVAAEQAKRDAGLPTLPSTIGLERATNPFLRDGEAAIANSLQMHGKLGASTVPQDVFTALREWKNHF